MNSRELVSVWRGDCVEVMRLLPDDSVDSVVTDPPYLLGFMGRQWDTKAAHEHIEWHMRWAAECLRVLKPGGHLLAFGGTRTWHRLACAIEDVGFEIRDSVLDLTGRDAAGLAWIYGSGFPKSLDVSKAIDRAAGAEREVVGRRFKVNNTVSSRQHLGTDAEGRTVDGRDAAKAAAYQALGGFDITAPATDDARRWQGWGTALKPGFEPIVVARKPAGHGAILAAIGSHLDELEEAWRARAAVQTTPTGAAANSSGQTDTSPSASMVDTSLSIVSSWQRCLAALWNETNTSTTGTTSSTTTDLKTLCSYLAQITRESTTPALTTAAGLTPLALVVDSLFAVAVTRSNATLALSAAEIATDETPASPQDGDDPALSRLLAWEPIIVARKPLAGTVAANVLTHGTGALNIDGTRIPHRSEADRAESEGKNKHADYGTSPGGNEVYGDYTMVPSRNYDGAAGRWPANVVLGEDAAVELDFKNGHSQSRKGKPRKSQIPDDGYGMTHTGSEYDDSGGPSRFFATFKYQAKASSKERPKVDGKGHPTVKPLDLIRWLVRLATPPGGLVLDLFAGSGTTGEACILEGFRCMLIDDDEEHNYHEMIEQRLAKYEPVAESS